MSKASRANDRPILDEAKKKALIALVGSAVSALVSFGFMSPELAEQISSGWAWALGAIVTALPFATSVLHSLGIVKGAEPKTTPVDSPTDNEGEPMVPLHAAGLDTAEDEPEVDEPEGEEEPEDLNELMVTDAPTEGRHRAVAGSAEETTTIPAVT